MQTMPGPIVNGGLIDFQDNFHRGMAEYANFQQAQQLAGLVNMQQQQYPSSIQPFHPGMGMPASAAPVPGVQAPAQLPCISGPPAFLHMHGQKYVPEDAQASSAKPATVSAAKPAVSETPEPRVLSEEEIERRVRDRVDAWAASQRKPVYASETRRHLKGRGVTDEERAAERIYSVNAGMRGRFHSPF